MFARSLADAAVDLSAQSSPLRAFLSLTPSIPYHVRPRPLAVTAHRTDRLARPSHPSQTDTESLPLSIPRIFLFVLMLISEYAGRLPIASKVLDNPYARTETWLEYPAVLEILAVWLVSDRVGSGRC